LTPQEIINGVRNKNRQLTDKNDELKVLIEEFSMATADYRIERAKKILDLKSQGHPVTLIKELANGDKNIAELKYKMMVAEGVYNACRSAINNIRISIDSYRSILTWLRAELNSGD